MGWLPSYSLAPANAKQLPQENAVYPDMCGLPGWRVRASIAQSAVPQVNLPPSPELPEYRQHRAGLLPEVQGGCFGLLASTLHSLVHVLGS